MLFFFFLVLFQSLINDGFKTSVFLFKKKKIMMIRMDMNLKIIARIFYVQLLIFIFYNSANILIQLNSFVNIIIHKKSYVLLYFIKIIEK